MTADQNLWKRLSEQIGSEDVKIRSAAIEELGNRDEIQSIRLLLRALTDISALNRQHAGQILIQRQHPAVVSGLIALLDSDKFHIRTCAASLLDQIPREVARNHIQSLLEDPQLEASLRTSLIGLFCRHADETMIPRINQFLSEPSEPVKKACIEGLNHSPEQWVTGYLTTLLQSTDAYIAQDAARSLMQRDPSPELVGQLVELLQIPGRTGDQAVSILSRIASEKDQDTIVPSLRSPDPLTRRRSLLLLSSIHPNGIMDHAVRMLEDDDEEIRQTAHSIISSRPVDAVLTYLQTNRNVSGTSLTLILSTLKDGIDNKMLVDLLESGGTDALDHLLQHRDAVDLITILSERLDPDNHPRFSRQLQIIGRIGCARGLSRLTVRDIPDTLRELYGRITLEIELREELATAGFEHILHSLENLARLATENGWDPGMPIGTMLDILYRTRDTEQRRQTLQETIRRFEKSQPELQSQLDRLDEQESLSVRRARSKSAMLLLLAASLVSTVICLVKNFKTPNSLWYLGFFVSVCLVGVSVLILRKLSRRTPMRSSERPSRTRESLGQQVRSIGESLAGARRELELLDGAEAGEEIMNLRRVFNTLPDYLVKSG